MIRCIQTFFSLGLCVAATAATPQFFDADVESAVPDVHEALLLTDSQKVYFDDIYAQLRPRYGIVDEAEFRRRGLKALSAPQLQLIADIEEAIAGIRAKPLVQMELNPERGEHANHCCGQARAQHPALAELRVDITRGSVRPMPIAVTDFIGAQDGERDIGLERGRARHRSTS